MIVLDNLGLICKKNVKSISDVCFKDCHVFAFYSNNILCFFLLLYFNSESNVYIYIYICVCVCMYVYLYNQSVDSSCFAL